MGIQTFGAEATVERVDEGVVSRLIRPGEVERDVTLTRLLIEEGICCPAR